MMLLLPVLLLFANSVCAEQKRYDGFKLLSITPEDAAAITSIRALELPLRLDFWLPPVKVGRPAEILVSPNHYEHFMEHVNTLHVSNIRILNENIQQEIDREQLEVERSRDEAVLDSSFDLNQYHSIEEIQAWLRSMAAQFPHLASVEDIPGLSYEGRKLTLIKIGAAKANATKPIYWLDAGIHAREWIAPATSLYIVNKLLSSYGKEALYTQLLDNIDFYIMPSMNPDGYAYTWAKGGDRLWRKTRVPYKYNTWFGTKNCYGADPNRNWDFHWAEAGTSDRCTSNIYQGPYPFSEPCTKFTSQYLTSLKPRLATYISLHSYSELFLYSYGYASKTYPKNYAEIKAEAVEAVADIKKDHGIQYKYGSPTDILYAAAGASDDWVKGVLGTRWVYTIELRPSNGSPYGFQLPAKYIQPTAEEAWLGMLDIAKKNLAEVL